MGVLPPAAALAGLPSFPTPAGSSPGASLSTALSASAFTPLPPAKPSSTDSELPTNLLGISLPAKVIAKILALEFVDMADLVQGNWTVQEDEDHKVLPPTPTAQGPSDGHSGMGGVLCLNGHSTVDKVSGQDPTVDGLSAHYSQGT